MRFLSLCTIVLLSSFLNLNLHARTFKCVALDSSSTCVGKSYQGRSHWNINCNNIFITGVATCSSTSASPGETSQTVYTSSTTGANKNCWCKMISPVNSYYYVAAQGYLSSDECLYNCSAVCTDYTLKFSTMRDGLFKSMTD